MITNSITHKYHSTGLMLIATTSIIILFQLLLFMPQLKPLWHSGMFNSDILPGIMWYGIVFCLFAHLVCWTTYTGLVYTASLALDQIFKFSASHLRNLAMLIWLAGVLVIFLLNQLYFPRSLFADFTMTFLGNSLAKILLIACLVFISAVSIVAIIGLIKLSLNYLRLAVLGSAVLIVLIAYSIIKPHIQLHSTKLPNIIIIGLDSLRPDYVDFYTHQHNNLTPNVDKFLSHSINFTNAITPLGQTYPAWISILTGLYPKHNGARYDLAKIQEVDLADSIALHTRKLGYYNIFATDERRFSNIDASYGFDSVIGPAIGINDFILGIFNDFPMSNLISNTNIGKWLFPYNHSNRASNLTYYPSTFTQDFQNSLNHIPHKQPLFLAIHLCISHWPYVWAATTREVFPPHTRQQFLQQYNDGLQQVDQQFSKIYKIIKHRGLLNNALVIVLSDHGESLNKIDDRLTTEKNYGGGHISQSSFYQWLNKYSPHTLNKSLGHGTDVLSPSQYHVVLGLRFYDLPHQQLATSAKFITTRVSLVDIKATIFSYLNIINYKSDGLSLLSLLSSPNPQALERFIFNESGFAPETIFEKNFDFQRLLKFALENYQVDHQTGLVSLRPQSAANIIAHKQQAVFYKQWLLTLYPSPSSTGSSIPVLVNLDTHQWTDNLNSELVKSSPTKLMLEQLTSFYGK